MFTITELFRLLFFFKLVLQQTVRFAKSRLNYQLHISQSLNDLLNVDEI